jgi:hypothetical protein
MSGLRLHQRLHRVSPNCSQEVANIIGTSRCGPLASSERAWIDRPTIGLLTARVLPLFREGDIHCLPLSITGHKWGICTNRSILKMCWILGASFP